MNTWSNMSPILWFNLVKKKVKIDSDLSVLSFLHARGNCSSICKLCINLLLHSLVIVQEVWDHIPSIKEGSLSIEGVLTIMNESQSGVPSSLNCWGCREEAIGKRRRGHKGYVFWSDTLCPWKKSLMAKSSLSLALEWSQNRWVSKGRDPLGAIMNNLKENDEGKTKERVPVI